MSTLQETLKACLSVLPESFRQTHQRLFVDEHLNTLTSKLVSFWQHGVPDEPPPPYLDVECTPSLNEAFAPFDKPVALWQQQPENPELLSLFAQAMVNAGCNSMLLLLGQRLTPASLTDASAIPPTRTQLLATATAGHGKDGLTVAGRAWTKHAHRSPDKFWGEVRGSVADKNAAALQLVSHILDHTTWWNVFGHYMHKIVYEARMATGHGVRWGQGGEEFIGFLEPFGKGEEEGKGLG